MDTHGQGIRERNLTSQQHFKRNRNWIHWSVRESDEGMGERVRERWRKRGDKWGKNSLPQLADLGNPAISQKPENRSRWAMSLHLSSSPSIHLPPFFSPLPHSPDELALCFSSSLTPLFPLLSSASSFHLHLTALTLPPPHPFSSLMMSWAVWLLLKPDYGPQWAHFTPLGMMPASQPDCGVTTDRQTALGTLLALIRMHTVDWEEKLGVKEILECGRLIFPPLNELGGRRVSMCVWSLVGLMFERVLKKAHI